jgi:small subunit ribosomal protein S16
VPPFRHSLFFAFGRSPARRIRETINTMVRIRLRRVGARHQPSFRIVVADRESPRDGRFLEIIGNYNPRTEPSTVFVDEARLFHWMQHGAQPSDSVRQVLGSFGTWERWSRLKAGESLEAILEEAKGAFPTVDPRTDRTDKVGGRPSKKARAKEKASAEEAETPPKAEAPAEVAEEAAPEAEMEAEPTEAAAVAEAGPEAASDAPAPEAGSDEAAEESVDNEDKA